MLNQKFAILIDEVILFLLFCILVSKLFINLMPNNDLMLDFFMELNNNLIHRFIDFFKYNHNIEKFICI